MRRFLRSRRLVILAAVVAVTLAGMGVTAATAATPDPKTVAECAGQTPPITDAHLALCLKLLAEAGRPADFSPRDAQVAAPSSVIAATGSESPTRRVQEVNNWRPNTQSWIDSKNRLAQSTGFTTADLEATSRWKPRITPLKALGVAGLLSTGAEIAWMVRDGFLYPALGLPDSATEDSFCLRDGNFATDLLGGVVGADCAPWRLGKDYEVLVGQFLETGTLSYGGVTVRLLRIARNTDFTTYCYSAGGAVPFPAVPGYFYGEAWVSATLPTGYHFATSSGSRGPTLSNATQGTTSGCLPKPHAFHGVISYGSSLSIKRTATGETVAETEVTTTGDAAEWVTRVRCLDGSSVSVVSEQFQQDRLGAVPQPREAQLGSCVPVGVDSGIQRVGTSSSSPWSPPSTGGAPNPDRVAAQTAEVPTEVQDWMRDFPNCADGSCLLELRKVIGGTMELDCFDAPDQCVNWSTEVAADPTTYRCYYGGSLVGIAECNVYTRVFDREKVQQGTGYADPATGESVKTSTGTTVTTNPGAASTAMSSPASDPSSSRQCWPTGWGAFNPFEWVFQPVKCALEWAFVPRDSAFQSFQSNLAGRFSSTSFGAVAGVVTAINVPGVGDGCTGPPLSFKYGEIDETWYPFSACDAPMAGVAATIKLWLGFLITAGAVFAIIRYVTAIIGFIPYGGGSSGGGRRGPRFEAGDE